MCRKLHDGKLQRPSVPVFQVLLAGALGLPPMRRRLCGLAAAAVIGSLAWPVGLTAGPAWRMTRQRGLARDIWSTPGWGLPGITALLMRGGLG